MAKKRPIGRTPEVGSYWRLRPYQKHSSDEKYIVLGVANKPVDPRFPQPATAFFRNTETRTFHTMPLNNWHLHFTQLNSKDLLECLSKNS